MGSACSIRKRDSKKLANKREVRVRLESIEKNGEEREEMGPPSGNSEE